MMEYNYMHPYAILSEETLGGLFRYILDGLRPGHALTALIVNDLFAYLERADTQRLAETKSIVMLLRNHCRHSDCYGDRKSFNLWKGIQTPKERQFIIDELFDAINKDRAASRMPMLMTIGGYYSSTNMKTQEGFGVL